MGMSEYLDGATRFLPIISAPSSALKSPLRLTRAFAEHDYNGISCHCGCRPKISTPSWLVSATVTQMWTEFSSPCRTSSPHSRTVPPARTGPR